MLSAPPLAAAYLALLAAALAMGLSPVLVRLAEIGPLAGAFWRVSLALPALYAWCRFQERGGPRGRSFPRATVMAGLAFAGDLAFWHAAIRGTSIANATFLATTAPVWVVLVSWLWLRQRPAAGTLPGLALCLAGGAALVGESLGLNPGRVMGDLAGLVTAVFFGLYFLTIAAARRVSGAARVTFEASLVTAAVLLALALAAEDNLLPGSGRGAAALVALALVSHAGGQGLLAVALGRLPATFSSLVIFFEAVAAALLGWGLLGEAISATQAGGGLLILAGIWVARPRPRAA